MLLQELSCIGVNSEVLTPRIVTLITSQHRLHGKQTRSRGALSLPCTPALQASPMRPSASGSRHASVTRAVQCRSQQREDRAGSGQNNHPVRKQEPFSEPSTLDSAERSWISLWALRSLQATLVGAAAALLLAVSAPDIAAAAVQKVGEFTGSGFIFKDSIEIMSLDDPAVDGVRIFVSDFKRSITDRLKKDFFNEPSQASISCAQTKAVRITGDLGGSEGAEIFAEGKGLISFKTLRVRRIYDQTSNTLVYVAYSTRLNTSDADKVSTGRYRTSICVIPLYGATVVGDDDVASLPSDLQNLRSGRPGESRREGGAVIKGLP